MEEKLLSGRQRPCDLELVSEGRYSSEAATVSNKSIWTEASLLKAFVAILASLLLACAMIAPQAALAEEANSSSDSFWSNPLGAIADGAASLFAGDSRATVSDATRIADNSTVDKYLMANRLGGDANVVSTQYDGRVWADKTVQAEDMVFTFGDGKSQTVQIGDDDFLTTYSLFATTAKVTGKQVVPADVVLVIDNSGSMSNNGNQALTQTVEAVNQSIRTLMNANAQNRVAVVLYDSDSAVLLPLGHYTPTEANGNYIAFTERGRFFKNTVNERVDYNNPTSNNPSDNNSRGWLDCGDSRGTNIQLGVYTGMNLLATEGSTTVEIGGKNVSRVPSVVLLSDGAATYSFSSSNWWAPNGNIQGPGGSAYYGNGMLAMATASYMKQSIDAHYGFTAESATKTKVYTIGMGLSSIDGDEKNLAEIALDPSGKWNISNNAMATSIKNAWETYSKGNSVTIRVSRNSNYTMRHPASGDISTLQYNDAYYAAESASDVLKVFGQITSDISTSTPEAPTEIVDGGTPYNSGYITYKDPIGQYMEVTDVKGLVYGEELYTVKSVVENGNTITYTFEGTINNEPYENVELSSIVIEVTGEPGNQTLNVNVPAAAIPLRTDTVDLDVNGNVVSNTRSDTYPMRILYGVSLVDGVADENGAVDLAKVSADYIKDNAEDGTLSFYANKYSGRSTQDVTYGDATVDFNPAETNPFYYYQQDTPIYYKDGDVYRPWTGAAPNSSDEFYVEYTYYEDKAQKTDYVARTGSEIKDFKQNGNGEYVIPAGTVRTGNMGRIGTIYKNENGEDGNNTKTADTVRYPVLEPGSEGALDNVKAYLGNNGKLSLELPGTLAVFKDAQVAQGSNLDTKVTKNKDFTFEVNIDPATFNASDTYTAEIKDINGNRVGDAFAVSFNAEGKCTTDLKLQDEQTLYIYGLAAGAAYTVTEVERYIPAGFENTSKTGDTGTLAANIVSIASFVNIYDVDPVTVGADDFVMYQKKFDRWDLVKDFEFQLVADNPSYPMPEGSENGVKSVTVTEDASTGTFGNVTFDKPGTYTYTVIENRPQGASVSGVSYSRASYSVTVVMKDNGNGTLSATSTVTKPLDDHGNAVAEADQPVDTKTALFENTFNATDVEAGAVAYKDYTDRSGNNPLHDKQFEFKIYPIGENAGSAPMPDSAVNGVAVSKNIGKTINFQRVKFTHDHVGKTYTYMIEEVMPVDATADNGYTVNGVTYDPIKYQLNVEVTSEDIDGKPTVHITKTYYKVVNDVVSSNSTAESDVVFKNVYDPKDLVIPNDTANVPLGTKILKGRDSFKDERFEFTLSAADNPTRDALADDYVIFGKDNDADKVKDTATVSIADLKNNVLSSFNFGTLTFKHPGTYKFAASEVVPDTDGGGMTWDRHIVTITINVEDNNGVLQLAGPVEYTGGASDNAAAFVNTYQSSMTYSDTTSLTVAKTLNGRQMNDGEFQFQITSDDEASAAKLAESDKAFANSGVTEAGKKHAMKDKLSKLEFTQEDAGKTFEYKVTEAKGSISGVTYDGTTYTVAIKVVDDGDGTMHPETTVTDSKGNTITPTVLGEKNVYEVPFVNTYKAGSTDLNTDAQFGLNKVLQGRDWLDSDSFEFTLAGENNAPMPEKTAATVTKADLKDGKAAFGFGKITYTEPGTYTYTVKETNDAAIKGIKYDSHVATVTVTVVDNFDGTMTASAQVTAGSATFTNVYTPGDTEFDTNPTDTNALFNKVLTGRNWTANDQFVFTLTSVNGAPMPEGTEEGATTKTVTVSDKDAKADEAVAFGFGKIKFTADDMEGAELNSDNKPSKTFEYKVAETKGSIPGVAYDEHIATLAVTVVDNLDGTMTATAKVTGMVGDEDVKGAFTNVYKAGGAEFNTADATLGLNKVLKGLDWTDDDKFEFTLSAETEGAPMPESTTATVKKADAKAGENVAFDFGTIKYDKAGEYSYKVHETNGGEVIKGITYTSAVAMFTVKVTDLNENGEPTGKLVATVSAKSGTTFTNIYSASIDQGANAPIDVTKVLNGRDMTQGEFKFKLEALDGEGTTAADAAKKYGMADGATSVEFDGPLANDGEAVSVVANGLLNLKLDLSDKDKVYKYELSEVQGEAKGVTYDDTKYVVEVSATDKGDGTMALSVKVNGEEKVGGNERTITLPFKNTYVSTTDIDGGTALSFSVDKVLTGRPLKAGEFNFEMKPQGNTDAKAVATATNTADGTVAFGPVNYTNESLNALVKAGEATKDGNVWKIPYTVSEVTSGLPGGVTSSKQSFDITVMVKDNLDGTLTASASLPEDAGFVNQYSTGDPVSVTLAGSKQLAFENGLAPADIAGKFTFTVAGKKDAPMPEKTEATNDANGNVDFGAIKFSLDNLNKKLEAAEGEERSASFTYTITESGSADGVTNDEQTSRTVTYTVSDDGKGELTVTRDPAEGSAFVFTNTYSVKPVDSSVTDSLKVTKNLDGRDLRDGEFKFELVEGTDVVAKGSNDVDGNVTMSDVTYTEPGEYHYILREVAKADGTNGVTYDAAAYRVVTTVADNGDGILKVKHEFVAEDGSASDSVAFNNTYKAAPTSIQFNAAKQLDGRDIVEGEFEFELVSNDEVIQAVKNAAADESGVAPVSFEAIEFTEPGEYDYAIREVAGNAEGVTYDDEVFTYHVVVTDNGEGNLEVEWTAGDNGAPVFTNTYEKPASPLDPFLPDDGDDDKLPKTGDTSPIVPLTVVVVLAACVAAVAALRMRRN